jgi:hypothetical protein
MISFRRRPCLYRESCKPVSRSARLTSNTRRICHPHAGNEDIARPMPPVEVRMHRSWEENHQGHLWRRATELEFCSATPVTAGAQLKPGFASYQLDENYVPDVPGGPAPEAIGSLAKYRRNIGHRLDWDARRHRASHQPLGPDRVAAVNSRLDVVTLDPADGSISVKNLSVAFQS